jgi:hypothetical protein
MWQFSVKTDFRIALLWKINFTDYFTAILAFDLIRPNQYIYNISMWLQKDKVNNSGYNVTINRLQAFTTIIIDSNLLLGADTV